MTDKEDVTLARTLGYFDATMIGVGAMIGAGIFVLTGLAVGEAGPGALLAFALNGIVTLITAFAYAELASSIPEAGGGYAFAKQAFPGVVGFLSGWMLWFAYTVACALYAVGFGGYFMELLHSYAPALSSTMISFVGRNGAVVSVTAVISAFFITLNYIGAQVTGKTENVLTMAKILILVIFSFFGVLAISKDPGLFSKNFGTFLPTGIGGVFVAMGLTFIAFEGYDLIATVSEEIKDPKRNIPRAIFTSLTIAVFIYLLIILVSVGAVDPTTFTDVFNKLPSELNPVPAPVLDPADPRINTSWEILGIYKETGIVRAAENFMPAMGIFLIVIGGLFSTMSALNASVLASSRVAFSMGREKALPGRLADIHPRRRTPHVAVITTGVIFVGLAVTLPIEVVGSSTSVLFLLSFAVVNGALIILRRKENPARVDFKVPFYPWLPAVGILLNLALALYQFVFSPLAWVVSLVWIGLGVVLYFVYARSHVEERVVAPVLMESRITERDYTVMVAVKDSRQAQLFGLLGSILAGARNGELLALHVIQVPAQLSLSEGREHLSSGQDLLEHTIQEGKARDVPVHTLLRIGRRVSQVIQITAEEQDVDLMLMGWPGYGGVDHAAYNRIINLIGINPPCDLAVVRFRKREAPEKILIATKGGFHAELALQVAGAQVDIFQRQTGKTSTITLFTVLSPSANGNERRRIENRLQDMAREHNMEARIKITEQEYKYDAILEESMHYDLVIVHAPETGLLEQRLFGSIPQRLAEECPKTLIMVKRHRPLQSRLMRWLGIVPDPKEADIEA